VEGRVSVYTLGKLNSQLLQKVEELTLYILQQPKQIDAQNDQIKQMNEKLNTLINK
jgi:trimeric autotransporter adhesin